MIKALCHLNRSGEAMSLLSSFAGALAVPIQKNCPCYAEKTENTAIRSVGSPLALRRFLPFR